MCLNIIKYIYDKLTFIVLNGGRLKDFPLRSGIRQTGLHSHHSFNMLLKVLARIIRKENKIKDIQTSKEEKLNCPVCRWCDLIFRKIPKGPPKLLDLINEFSKVLVHKSNIQRSVVFLNTNNEPSEKAHKRTMPFKIASKKYLGKI